MLDKTESDVRLIFLGPDSSNIRESFLYIFTQHPVSIEAAVQEMRSENDKKVTL